MIYLYSGYIPTLLRFQRSNLFEVELSLFGIELAWTVQCNVPVIFPFMIFRTVDNNVLHIIYLLNLGNVQ